MARAVLVHFDDNKAAERFVRTIERLGHVTVDNESEDATYPEEFHDLPARVAAVVAVPVKWCTCNVPEGTGRRRRQRRESGWTRGTRFGWWLCVHCKRPSKAMVTHWYSSMLVGANDLLPEILGTGDPISAVDRWRRDGGVGEPVIRNGDHLEHI